MGWVRRSGRVPRPRIDGFEVAIQFERLVNGSGTMKLRSAASGKSTKVKVPLKPGEAINVLWQLHPFKSKEACWRRLEEVRALVRRFAAGIGRSGARPIVSDRLASLPSLEDLPSRFGKP
jgi:hypothetical protein